MCVRDAVSLVVPRPAAGGRSSCVVALRTATAAVLLLGLAGVAGGRDRPGTGEAELRGEAELVEDELLARLIHEALAGSPDLQAAEAAARAGREGPVQARALPDPTLSLVYTNDGWSPSLGEQDMTNLAFMGSQALPWPGKRGIRGRIAEREADLGAWRVERVRLSLVAAVKRAYLGLLLAREQLALVAELAHVWGEIEGVARARYAIGQGAQQDVLRVQVEVTRVEQLREEQQVEAAVRLAELNRLLARPAEQPLDTPARLVLRREARPLAALVEWTAAVSPEIRAAATSVEGGRLALELARLDFKPDFAVQAGYMNRGGLDPMWQAGVSVSLPLDRGKRHAAVAETELRLRAGERRLEAVRLQLRFRTQERLARLGALQRIAGLYRDGIILQGQMSVEAAIANYQAGKVPFVTVLEALVTLYGDRATHLRLLASHERTRASLEEASLEGTTEMPSDGESAMTPAAPAGPGGMAPGPPAGGGDAAPARTMGSMGN